MNGSEEGTARHDVPVCIQFKNAELARLQSSSIASAAFSAVRRTETVEQHGRPPQVLHRPPGRSITRSGGAKRDRIMNRTGAPSRALRYPAWPCPVTALRRLTTPDQVVTS
ncbi:unnamed protein product [Calypogeia fissa]